MDDDNGGGDDANGLEDPSIAMTSPDADRAAVWSRSHTFLEPLVGAASRGAVVYAEVRPTFAPITFFEGQAFQFTVDEEGEEVTRILTTQDLLGDEGRSSPMGDPELGLLADVTIGEAPRAIGGDFGSEPDIADDGTHASDAVDAVGIQLLSSRDTFEFEHRHAYRPHGGVGR